MYGPLILHVLSGSVHCTYPQYSTCCGLRCTVRTFIIHILPTSVHFTFVDVLKGTINRTPLLPGQQLFGIETAASLTSLKQMGTCEVSSKDVALDCVLWTEQERQCAYNVTLWCVGITIVTLEKQQYVPFLLLLTYITVNNKQCAVLPWKWKNGFPWQRCRAAKYFIRLSTTRTVWRLHAMWPIFYDFNGIWSVSIDSRIKVPNVKFRGNPFSGESRRYTDRTKL